MGKVVRPSFVGVPEPVSITDFRPVELKVPEPEKVIPSIVVVVIFQSPGVVTFTPTST
jgi:hypothetical protein